MGTSHPAGSRTSDYEFDLPPRLIAQQPLPRRDDSRLMVVRREGGAIEHRRFRELAELVDPGDALVVNATRVFRARLLGRRASGAPAEVLLLRPLDAAQERWEAMVSPGGKLKPGRVVQVADGLEVEIEQVTERRTRVVRIRSERPVMEAIDAHGHVPLPPYIARADDVSDEARYQTVYAGEQRGSVAAPTAGLHFTPELLAALESRGVRRAEVVLHVGAGTFKPVEVEDPAQHVMHEERYQVPQVAAEAVNAVRRSGGRVWAVGTTSVRTLESAAREGELRAGSGDTGIFIRPPHDFALVDRLITNFHLPRSTLLMLVAAFAGYELTMRAYREAVEREYRFYSYGDAMVVI